MPITPADLISPKGRLEPSFFPGDDSTALTSRLQGYLEEADGRIPDHVVGEERDLAKAAWAYHRAFDAVATRLNANPANVTLNDQGSIGYLKEQIAMMEEKASGWLESFNSMIAPADSPRSSGTGATRTRISWW